jgi:hypothetical protein
LSGEAGKDKTRVQLFRSRWQAAAQAEQEDALRATLELRWQQLNAQYGLAGSLNLPYNYAGEMEVYEHSRLMSHGTR